MEAWREQRAECVFVWVITLIVRKDTTQTAIVRVLLISCTVLERGVVYRVEAGDGKGAAKSAEQPRMLLEERSNRPYTRTTSEEILFPFYLPNIFCGVTQNMTPIENHVLSMCDNIKVRKADYQPLRGLRAPPAVGNSA